MSFCIQCYSTIKDCIQVFFNNIQPFFIVYLIMVSHILTKYIYLIKYTLIQYNEREVSDFS